MSILALSSTPRTFPGRIRDRAIVVSPQCNTLWSLSPRKTKPQFFETSTSSIDLTGAIGKRKLCSVGARDYAEKTSEAIDFTIVDHGGLHILFEAEGTANPVDSPSVLYLTDVDSECDVIIDGKIAKKGERTRLKPGAAIEIGNEASYIVHRNVFAHA